MDSYLDSPTKERLSAKNIEQTRSYSSSDSCATALLPGQDKPAPPGPMSRASLFVVSCGVRLSVIGFNGFRKPQVVRSVLIGGSTPHSVKKIGSPDFAEGRGRDEISARLLYFHTQDAQNAVQQGRSELSLFLSGGWGVN